MCRVRDVLALSRTFYLLFYHIVWASNLKTNWNSDSTGTAQMVAHWPAAEFLEVTSDVHIPNEQRFVAPIGPNSNTPLDKLKVAVVWAVLVMLSLFTNKYIYLS